MLRGPLGAPAHEGADGRGRGVEDGDAVALDDLPEAILLRPVGRAFVHQHGGAVRERSVDDVAVAGDPADVGRAPVDVVLLEVEDPLGRGVAAGEIAAGRVDDALRLPGRARRVEDVEHVLRVHRLGLAVVGRLVHDLVVPVVAARLHVHAQVGGAAFHDDDRRDRRRGFERLVGHLLERHDAAAAIAAVGRHQHLALRVVDAIAQRLAAEAAEDHAVHGADAGAGQHRNRQLRHQRHVDRDPVALGHAMRLEHVGELGDLPVEREVGQRAPLAGLAFPDEGGLVAARAADVPVDAVHAGVELAAHEPLRIGRRPLEHRVPRPHPLQFLREPGPEGLGIGRRARVDLRIVHGGGGAEGRARLEAAVLAEERIDLRGRLRGVVGHAPILSLSLLPSRAWCMRGQSSSRRCSRPWWPRVQACPPNPALPRRPPSTP